MTRLTLGLCVPLVSAGVALAQPVPVEARPTPPVPAPLRDLLHYEPGAEDLTLSEGNEDKADALASFVEGLLHEQHGRREQMLDAFQMAFDLDPDNSELAQKLAVEYVRAGDVPEGIGVLKDALKRDPENTRLHLLLATLYARSLGKFDRAADYTRQALAIDPENPEAYEMLLGIHTETGDTAAARSLLEEAVRVESDDPAFWLSCGQLAARALLDSESERESGDDLIDRFFELAAEHADGDGIVLSEAGDYFLVTRRPARAITLYKEAIRAMEPGAPRARGAREKLARAYLMDGQRDRAVETLEELVEDNPLQREAYEFLGRIHEEAGEYEQALAHYEQVLLIQPVQPISYLRVADLYVRLGRPEKSIEVLEEARAEFPDVPQMTYSLAIAYSQAERHELALKTFEAALEEARFYGEEIATAAFYFNYGVAADAAGDFTKSVECFKKSIEMDPANAAPALNYLGYMMVLRETNLDEAEAFIRRALELDPANGAYVDSLGWLFFKQGRYEEALEQLLRAETLIDPTHPMNYEIFDHIGDAYEKLGQSARAVEYWRKALDLDPDNEGIAAKIERSDVHLSSRRTGADAPAAESAE